MTQIARILVVEDDPRLRGMVADRLVKAGFEVIVTDRAVGAVDAAVACLPNVIILDAMIPELRADPETARIPVLLLSAGMSPGAVLGRVRELLRRYPTPIDPNTGFRLDRSFRW
ncbi:hypothetical protein [Dactylosporangium sp. CA-092794]|uniref:hypothetical protein n=1 Tax=Dactylosporangium sp. CA-092794 TaxID=3239929 RepID=UPI003D8B6A28